ncbi:Blp family class II bacteriocin [Flavobacterium sp. LAR06]|uniref:Blp family class II bacteriocin n=1 Tax=Flavobacterium sp. LAR06 TaxID=3064897 RepID=UPI0035C1FAEA
MKKQNANNKLAFNKVSVSELNDNQMYSVEGGTSPATVSSTWCAAAIGAAVGGAIAWAMAD